MSLKDDPNTALRGVLWQARGPWLTLVRAELLKITDRREVEATRLDGESVVVHRDNVAFMQVLP